MLKALRVEKGFYKMLAALAVPIILQNLINSSLGLVDTIMVGTLGQNELAGLSLANTPFFVAQLFVFGLQSGGAVLISQYWGKRDMTTINRVLGISWFCAGLISFLFATVVFLFPRQIMGLTTNNPELLEIAVRYGRIVAYSNFLNAIVMIYVGAQRSCENPRFGMVVTTVSMVSNVFFNYIFIFGKLGFPAMGVEGAALGTLLARIVEVIFLVIYILFKDKTIKIIPSALFRPGIIIVKDFLKYSLPVILNETLWGLGTSIFPIIYGHMADSSDIVAAYSIAGNIDRILSVAVFAVANAAAVVIGKEIGAGRSRDEVFSIGKTLAAVSIVIGLFSGLFILGGTQLLVKPFVFRFFDLSANAERIAVTMLMIMSAVTVFRSFNTSLIVGILRGGGDVKFGLFLDTATLYLWSIPLGALTGLVLGWDISAVYILIVSEDIIKFVIGYIRFRSGKWINNLTREITS